MAKIARDATELVGHTPLVRLNRVVGDAGARVVAKLESYDLELEGRMIVCRPG